MLGPQPTRPYQAFRRALEERQELGLMPHVALCPYDVAEQLGIEVWFQALPSMEGLYRRGDHPVIILSSERPFGRQAYTCSHEIGHHVFGHGSRVEEIFQGRRHSGNPVEEVIADSFAGFLLMPKLAVERAFRNRGFDPCAPSPRQLFTVAGHLGVGYTTLVTHMVRALRLLSRSKAEALMKVQPRVIRADIAGRDVPSDLWIVDDSWTDRPLDVQVGDVILVPISYRMSGPNLVIVGQQAGTLLFQAGQPGSTTILRPDGMTCRVRVARRGFVGRYRYRYLPEAL